MKLFKFFLNVILAIMLTLSLFGCDKGSSNQNATDTSATDSDSAQDKDNKDADDYIFPDSDKTLLNESDLEDLPLKTLELGRNEIFARHGYVFKTEEIKKYFSEKSWYKPNENFKTDNDLNGTERKNIDLIKSIEAKKTNQKIDDKTPGKTYGKIKQVSVENGTKFITFDKVEWLTNKDIQNRQDVKDYLTKQYGSLPTQLDDDYIIYDPDSNLTKLQFSANGTISNWKFTDDGIQTFTISFDDLQKNAKQNDMAPQDGVYAISVENNNIVKLEKMYQP